jgi:hypothetical protein
MTWHVAEENMQKPPLVLIGLREPVSGVIGAQSDDLDVGVSVVDVVIRPLVDLVNLPAEPSVLEGVVAVGGTEEGRLERDAVPEQAYLRVFGRSRRGRAVAAHGENSDGDDRQDEALEEGHV